MKLKKIEVQGFKSFADKINIIFKDGITAIVGPNGSGKSNISDAIRWVLGEQSVKNLRGKKMQDIIFAGTSTRKALGYTEVTIIFDNKSGKIPVEYEEVAITRRMFRSGESEYYLNKNSCRLRDIRELFMDTGVGKDGYSIIGQGRIDEILSNRPEDRRSIFEEAAGIVKYKSKKEEAEKKLSKTESNLLRIKDLVTEVSGQHDNLKLQAENANRFKVLYDKLKKLEVCLYLNNIETGKKNVENINNEIFKMKKILEANISDKEYIDNKFNILKENTENLDIEIEKYRKKEINVLNEIEKNKNNVIVLQEKKNFNLKDLERIEGEKNHFKNKLKTLEKSNFETKKEINLKEKEYNELSSDYSFKLKELEEKLEKTKEVERKVELEKDSIFKKYNKISEKKSKLNSIVAFNDNIEKRSIQLNKRINEIKIEKKSNLEKYKEFDRFEKKLEEQIVSLKKEFDDLKDIERINLLKDENLNKKINSLNIELQGKTSSLNLFKNMEKSYEGYYRGVKSVLKASENNEIIRHGLVGVVAELIKVDEKFEKAIDVSLGSNAQNIVTKTEEDAKNIINYLKKNKLGRVTCLPLNIMRGKTLQFSSKERKEFQILGLASEIIDYEKKHEELFKSLLGRTIIVENMDYGIRLANKYNHSYRIVTLAGEILNPGGSMTGGSYSSNSTSIISRKNRIDKLEKEIFHFKETQKKLLNDKDVIGALLKENKEKIKKYEEQIKKTDYETINISNNKENQKLELLRNEELINNFKEEIHTLNNEGENYDFEKNKLKDSLDKLEIETKELKENINKLSENLSEKNSFVGKLNNFVLDMRIKLNKEENKINNLKEKLASITTDMENINIQLKERKDLIVTKEFELKGIDKSHDKIVKVIDEMALLRNNNKIKLEKLIEEKQNFMEDYYLEQENLKNINEVIANMEKNKNTKEIELTKINFELENYYKKLEEDYELSYHEALAYKKDSIDAEKDISEIKKLKKEIKKIGAVNLSSIDEYEKVKTRLDFLIDQKNDLNTAKEDLRKVILDMESKMKKQFNESFDIINENFKEIFSILFDGGKAELILEDKENILKTGIEIKAQPPGKRLQNLSLLSGGEKSLTAVALLFSILKIKPAPFCVLDEIDAALDEANIGRYTKYLKDHCKETQFIIITHRKTTMEMADVLYGVTMEEEGISKLISVELKDNMEIIAS